MNNVVTFEPQPDGQSLPQCINIQIVNDDVLEGEEMFFVEIQNSNSAVSLNPLSSQATVVIVNEDST